MQQIEHNATQLREVCRFHVDGEIRFQVQKVSGYDRLWPVFVKFAETDFFETTDDVPLHERLFFNFFLRPGNGFEVYPRLKRFSARQSYRFEDRSILYAEQRLG